VQFKKWQFVSATYAKARADARPESIHIHQDSIRAGEWLSPGKGWARRRAYTDPLVVPSVEALRTMNDQGGTSLGIIRPREIEDLTIERAGEAWDEASEHEYTQLSMQWQAEGLPISDLERIPYRFRYKFRCQDAACRTGHEMVILDWEIGEAFRKWRRAHGEAGALSRIREKYLVELPSRELFLVLGTHHVYGNWMIVGVFAIPLPKIGEKERAALRQRTGESASMTLPWVELETQQRDPLSGHQAHQPLEVGGGT
jgi:hypothetical protein